jgi:DNA-binding response OmpR family regulator
MTDEETIILVAEDDRQINNLIGAKLKKEGFKVIQTYDGKEALSVLLQGKANLALLNMMMPYLDGRQVLQQIRAAGLKIPVVIFSVKSRESDLRQCLLLGANDYLVKPFQLADLVQRINNLLTEP